MSVYIYIIADDNNDIYLLSKILHENFDVKIVGKIFDENTIIIGIIKHAFTLINNIYKNDINVKEVLNNRNKNIFSFYQKTLKNKNCITIKYEDIIKNYYVIIKLLIGKLNLIPKNNYNFKCILKKEIKMIDPLFLEKYKDFKLFDATENDKIIIPESFNNFKINQFINSQYIELFIKNINLILEKRLNYYCLEKFSPEVCFFHIEKCMGSSLRNMLYNYYKNIYSKNDIFLPEYYNNLNLVSEEDLIKLCCINNNFKVLLCHCSYNKRKITDLFSKKCYSITCLREPIKRFISHYYYFIKPFTKKNIQELAHDELIKIIHSNSKNILKWRLSGETEKITDALKNINLINCILITETIETDIKYLNEILNKKYNINQEILCENINGKRENYDEQLDYDYIKNNFYNEFSDDYVIYNTVLNMNIENRIKNL